MFRLKTLGTLVLEGPEGAVAGSASQRRTLALLALLAAAGEKGVSRERLTGLLWPDSDEDRARHVLAQMIYRVRQQLGDSSIEGTTTLRLNSEVLASDVRDFERALSQSDWETAARAYGGPFLEGFYLPDAAAFERWVESERGRLAQRYSGALDRLVKDARARGDTGAALEWARSRAAIDPLDSVAAAQLLEALVAAGDRPGALQFARVYEALLREQLDTDPGPDFTRLVASIRNSRSDKPEPASAPDTAAIAPSVPTVAIPQPPQPEAQRDDRVRGHALAFGQSKWRWYAAAGIVALAGLGGVGLATLRDRSEATDERRTVAVGYIADYTDDTLGAGRSVPELLTTSLSQLDRLDVIGRSRLYDILARLEGGTLDATGFARAAERAGAAELIDGALYRKSDGTFRLDVRVLDLRSGIVRAVHQISARDAFALTDTATIRLAETFGLAVPSGLRVADVTTRSPVAYKFYEEALRASQQRDFDAARRLFTTALSIDTTFAMAAYGASRAYRELGNGPADDAFLRRAFDLRAQATERERLLLEAVWADHRDDPSRVPLARRLTARFPNDPEAYVILGRALHWQGDFAGAVIAYKQALALDSASLAADGPQCHACEALSGIAAAYTYMDAWPLSEQTARFLVEARPRYAPGWYALSEALFVRGDFAGALAADRRRQSLLTHDDNPFFEARVAIWTGQFDRAEELLRAFARSPDLRIRTGAYWWLTISHRYQGRLTEALRSVSHTGVTLAHAQVLFESERYMEAARTAAPHDSSWRLLRTDPRPSHARNMTWVLLHQAAALAAAGETNRLRSFADSLESIGRRSGYGRDHRLHHHVRALMLETDGRPGAAVEEFRRAMWSPTGGYTRTNFELGRLLIQLGRAHEAVPLLQAALRNDGTSSALYVTHTELHALLSRAFSETGPPDSARVHREWAERAWRNSDANVRDRIPQLLNLQRKP